MDVDIKVDGLQELEKQLKKLEAFTGVKVLNSALMSATKPAYDRARQNASQWPTLRNSIRRVKHRNLNKRRGKAAIRKGFRGAATPDRVTGVSIITEHRKAPHFHLLELGTAKRTTTRPYIRKYKNYFGKGYSGEVPMPGGMNRGTVKPNYMMTRAFKGKAHADEAIAIFQKRVRAQLKKLSKKGVL